MSDNEERWRELCAQAAIEQDSRKLMELVKEISRLLAEKERRGKSKAEEDSNGDPPKQVER